MATPLAPTAVGFLSTAAFAGGSGLEYTFLALLGTLLAAGVVLLGLGVRTYPHDVAVAAEQQANLRRL